MTGIEAAAWSLREMFLKGNVDQTHFSVGMGSDRLHAYMRCSRKQWRGPQPDTMHDYPIDWRWNVGPTVAA